MSPAPLVPAHAGTQTRNMLPNGTLDSLRGNERGMMIEPLSARPRESGDTNSHMLPNATLDSPLARE